MVVTGGDPLADLVKGHGLGLLVAYRDVEGVGQAVLRLLESPRLKDELAPSFREVVSSLTWEESCQPLARFCQDPYTTSGNRALAAAPWEPAGGQASAPIYGTDPPRVPGVVARALSRVPGIGTRLRNGP